MRFQLVTFFFNPPPYGTHNFNIEIHWNVLIFGVFWGTSPSTGFKFSPRGYNYCTYFSTKTKFCMFHLV